MQKPARGPERLAEAGGGGGSRRRHPAAPLLGTGDEEGQGRVWHPFMSSRRAGTYCNRPITLQLQNLKPDGRGAPGRPPAEEALRPAWISFCELSTKRKSR